MELTYVIQMYKSMCRVSSRLKLGPKTAPSQKSVTLKQTLKLKIIMQYFRFVLPQMSLLGHDEKFSLNSIFSTKIKIKTHKIIFKFTKIGS